MTDPPRGLPAKKKRGYERRVAGLKDALTPSGLDLTPCREKFPDFETRFGRRSPLGRVAEPAAQRLAILLNRLMRTEKDTPQRGAVAEQLREVASAASHLANALERMHGVSAGMLTRADNGWGPFYALPGEDAPSDWRPVGDATLREAFGPEVEALEAIKERECKRGLAAASETSDPRQLAALAAYDDWRIGEQKRRSANVYNRWRGPPARKVLVEPFINRVHAVQSLAWSAASEVGAVRRKRGKRAAYARGPWETVYAKVCWLFIREECGEDVALGLTAAENGDFLAFIRVRGRLREREKDPVRLWGRGARCGPMGPRHDSRRPRRPCLGDGNSKA